MSNIRKIGVEEARRLTLYTQGLSQVPGSTYEAIRQLSYVQIDSISVAARAHHHILWSRNNEYRPADLNRLMADRQVFEYWSHAAAILPMDDYRFSLYPKGEVLKADKFWFEKDKKVMRHVMRRIKAEGPLQSKDFEYKQRGSNPWFDWKPTKQALQLLFMEGRIMVKERQGFQKIYDLTERVIPEGLDLKKPTQKQFCGYLIDRAVQAHGLVTDAEIGYLRKGLKAAIRKVLIEKVRRKELVKVTIGEGEEVYYTTEALLDKSQALSDTQTLHLLSPFDNLVIQRSRLQNIFNFDYLIECYVPEKKRVHGYYTVPILYGSRFVGRLDPKADRKLKVFYIKNLWFEEGFVPDETFMEVLALKLKAFAVFCECNQVIVRKTNNPDLKDRLKRLLD